MSRRSGLTSPLSHRDFRYLFSAQLVSNLGDWLDFLALAVLIAYVWGKGAGSLAALAIVIAVPWIFVAPFSGVLADRWPKRSTMIGADLARAAIVCGYIVAPNLPVLLTLVGLKTAFSTLFSPAEQATIRIIVPEELLTAANSLSQLVVQSTKVLGPALGGVLVSVASPRFAFGVDAATFVLSAAILTRLGTIKAPSAEEEEDEGGGGFWQELRTGLVYVVSRRALVIAMISFAAAIFLLLAFDSLSPLAFRELGVGKAMFGVAIGAIGLGGVLGAVTVGRYAGDVNPFALMGAGSAVIGSLIVVMGLGLVTSFDPPPVVWAPVLFVIGVASAGVLIALPTILQKETPPELMGRVSTSATALPTVGQLAAPLVGATLAAWQSVGFVFTVAGGALAALGGAVLLVRPPVGVDVPGQPEAVAASPPPPAGLPADADAVNLADVTTKGAAT
jgi:MFS family permease